MASTPESCPEDQPNIVIQLRRFLFVAALISLDLWSKSAVFSWLGDPATKMVHDACGHVRYHVLGEQVGWFTFMLSENPGAAFGQFAGFPHALIGLRVVAVIVLSVMIWRAKLNGRWVVAALILVLSGALGNLYDNLFREATGGRPYGMVRDFIDVYFVAWKKHFPTFNVADSCISVGAAILLIGSFGKGKEKKADSAESDAPVTMGALEPDDPSGDRDA